MPINEKNVLCVITSLNGIVLVILKSRDEDGNWYTPVISTGEVLSSFSDFGEVLSVCTFLKGE